MDRYTFRGKRVDNGEWVTGYYTEIPRVMIFVASAQYVCGWDWFDVDPATVSRCTGLRDKNKRMIFDGDITELVLPDGDVRRFEVKIKTVIRKVVSHPDFDALTAKVAITGVVFLWRGYELFPCVDENGVADISKMTIIGNRWDNPDLLGEEGHHDTETD